MVDLDRRGVVLYRASIGTKSRQWQRDSLASSKPTAEVFNGQHLRSGQFGAHGGSRKPTGVSRRGGARWTLCEVHRRVFEAEECTVVET